MMRRTGSSAAKLTEAARNDAKDCTTRRELDEAMRDDAKYCTIAVRLAEARLPPATD